MKKRTDSEWNKGFRFNDVVVVVKEAFWAELFGLCPVFVAHVDGEGVEDEEGVARNVLTRQRRVSVVVVKCKHCGCRQTTQHQ